MPNIVEINVTVPSESRRRGAAFEELDKSLKAIPAAGYAEIWVNHDWFPALCVLVNGEQAWLMCLRFSGDAGFSSRNPSFVGKPDATLENDPQADRLVYAGESASPKPWWKLC